MKNICCGIAMALFVASINISWAQSGSFETERNNLVEEIYKRLDEQRMQIPTVGMIFGATGTLGGAGLSVTTSRAAAQKRNAASQMRETIEDPFNIRSHGSPNSYDTVGSVASSDLYVDLVSVKNLGVDVGDCAYENFEVISEVRPKTPGIKMPKTGHSHILFKEDVSVSKVTFVEVRELNYGTYKTWSATVKTEVKVISTSTTYQHFKAAQTGLVDIETLMKTAKGMKLLGLFGKVLFFTGVATFSISLALELSNDDGTGITIRVTEDPITFDAKSSPPQILQIVTQLVERQMTPWLVANPSPTEVEREQQALIVLQNIRSALDQEQESEGEK